MFMCLRQRPAVSNKLDFNGVSKDMKKLLKKVQALGYLVEKRRRGHYKVHCPDGPVFVSGTPGANSAHKLAARDMRSKGVDV